jgi:hypothetical protein
VVWQLSRAQGLSLFLPRASLNLEGQEGIPLSASSSKPGSNGQRAAAVQRLKAAVAERKQAHQQREAGKVNAAKVAKSTPLRQRRTGA